MKSVKADLFRSNSIISSLASALGNSLSETRLTGMLGYLISNKPGLFLEKLKIKGKPLMVKVEHYSEQNRSDIFIQTSIENVLIEAKINATNPYRQALKYKADKRILLTTCHRKDLPDEQVYYITWADILIWLSEIKNDRDYKVKFVSNDLITYLKEQYMSQSNSTEIYAREINDKESLSLFLHGGLYTCKQEGGESAQALYFAPHFGQKISNIHPGVLVGISYCARIEAVNVYNDRGSLESAINKNKGNTWLRNKNNKEIFDQAFSGWIDEKDIDDQYIFFLNQPRLVWNPSVKKEFLQEGTGWLSKRYYTFDELFQAWKGEKIY